MNYVFLLGGQDLEMLEIKKILNELGLKYIDKKLSWGAKWSDFSEDLKNPNHENTVFAGIELSGKEEKPFNAIDIDHHNIDSELSSIEQIAQQYNVKLNRWQKLVAANDKEYIGGMKKMCATDEEIEKVRIADRKAQGVTIEDEKLAEKSIEENLEVIKGITVVYAQCSKFSPITDRLFLKTDKLLIYNNSELNYYGCGKSKLVELYSDLIQQEKAYHGGGNNGFFGISANVFNTTEINSFRSEILHELSESKNEKQLYSHHIFLFPFKWEHNNLKKDASLDEKYDLEEFEKKLSDKCRKWERKEFNLNFPEHYNEYNYFYNHVREVLYDLNEELSDSTSVINKSLINHFEYKIENDLHYCIRTSSNTYYLEIDSILLNIYSTGTAVLSFHLRNFNYSSKDDILKINQFGRRIYPPFLGLNKEHTAYGMKTTIEAEASLNDAKSELACAIWLGVKESDPDERNPFYDDFSRYLIKDNYQNGPFILPNFINSLFSPDFIAVHERKENESPIIIQSVIDDRMFVVSWYGNKELACKFKTYNAEQQEYGYINCEWWYKYLFIDAENPSCDNILMRNQLIKEHSYSRWVGGYGTLYGISRYSLVCITSDFDNTAFLVQHMQSMYYKMAELCLLQRATTLSYSDEVTHISQDLTSKDNSRQISNLYEKYILFRNKIYFREITAQEQGIEMYAMLQEKMRLPKDVIDLDSEIEELNRFAGYVAQEEETNQLKKHTILATLFLPAMLISGILGMNTYGDTSDIPIWFISFLPVWPFWIGTGAVFLIILIVLYGHKVIKKKR